MCGIYGSIYFTGKYSYDIIKKINSSLFHRGPDDSGYFSDEKVFIGQTRLSINDLRQVATPPLTNEDGTIHLVFNGEIYNFKELREELIKCGHYFKTLSDTETIIHAYEEYGYKCLNYFNGMFAFALWDSHKGDLFCARDRLGKKPFCYSHNSNNFRFGSEIKAITAAPDFHVEPDYAALDIYLSYGYIPSPLSAFKGIRKLPPAHYLVCSKSGDVVIRRYWSPPGPSENHLLSIDDIKRELKEKLNEAIRLRMISDVPLGAFLSGGIDSTTVVALMAMQSSNPIKTFSIGFSDEKFNELPYAKLLAEKYGTEHHEFIVEPDAASILPKLIYHYNEPFADPSAVPTYYVSKLTRQHVTVALSGDGGDENYAGYERYTEMAKWNKWAYILKSFKPFFNVSEKALNLLPYNNLKARVQRALYMLGADISDQYRMHMSVGLKPQEKNELYSDQFLELINFDRKNDPIKEFSHSKRMSSIDFCMVHDQNFYLPDALMVKADIASMANSLELRAPFLDYRLVEFASSIPLHFKVKNGLKKWIIREAFGHLLPAEILKKPKSGFSVPVASWLRKDLKPLVHDVLLDSKAKSRGLFDQNKVTKMVYQHEKGVRSWANRLWTLLILELWFREFVD